MWVRTDRQDGSESIVTEARVRRMVHGYVRNVALALRTAKAPDALPITTSFAYYEWREAANRKEARTVLE